MAEVKIRRAEFGDIEFLWWLRNQPEIYQFLDNNEPLTDYGAHISWLGNIIKGYDNQWIFIIIADDVPTGSIRLKWQKPWQCWVAGIMIEPKRQKQGIATNALGLVIEKLRPKTEERRINSFSLITEIDAKNKASLKLFEKCGFSMGLGDGDRRKDDQGRLWITHFLML